MMKRNAEIEREVGADVTVDRWRYIGGSDIPAIMGISPWKTLDRLVEEKSGPGAGGRWGGNELTRYGHDMEPVIRDRVNELRGSAFEDGWRAVLDDMRYHADGIDWRRGELLEVKTTGANGTDGYDLYLVQMLFGMLLFGIDRGVLAVYGRPEDLSLEMDDGRLHIHEFRIGDYAEPVGEMESALDSFRGKVAAARAERGRLLSAVVGAFS